MFVSLVVVAVVVGVRRMFEMRVLITARSGCSKDLVGWGSGICPCWLEAEFLLLQYLIVGVGYEGSGGSGGSGFCWRCCRRCQPRQGVARSQSGGVRDMVPVDRCSFVYGIYGSRFY